MEATPNSFASPRASAESRRFKRSLVMLSARAATPRAEVPAVIRDISAGGAQITTSLVVAAGAEVVLRRDSVSVEADVAWCEGMTVGLRFRNRIDEHALLVCLGRKTG